MRIRTLLIAAALTVATAATAQTDVVYLKNGSTFHGTIDKRRDGSTLTIRNAEGDVLTVNQADIEKIDEAPAPVKVKKRGYRGFADADFFVGSIHFDPEQKHGTWAGAGVTTTHGFMFSRHIFFGFGFGLAHIGGTEFTDYGEPTYESPGQEYKVSGATIIPIYCAFRAYFRQKAVEPFAGFRAGGFTGDDHSGGLCELTGGVRIRQRINVSAGFLGIIGDAGIGCESAYEIASFVVKVGIDFGRLK